MPKGLLKKYRITKANGRPADPRAEYFVLRLDYAKHDTDTDTAHVNACRAAVRQYAQEIEPWLPGLARELREKYPMPASAIGQPIAPGKEHDGHR
jgi:hypothetical protein